MLFGTESRAHRPPAPSDNGGVKPPAPAPSGPPSISDRLGLIFRQTGWPGIASAYLFGSHAADRAHRESDVDVGILLVRDAHPSAALRFEERIRLSGALQAALRGPAVDVMVLNDAPPTLGRHIVNTGQRVFCADPEADHAYRRDVQLRAADLEPFLRRMRRLKLEAIGR
jgi:predicted nucleotidyltransferase